MKKESWFERLFGGSSKPSSAEIAKDRLAVLVASKSGRLTDRLTPDRVEQMKREVADVVGRYISGVDTQDINIRHYKENGLDMLEMNINLPDKY